MKKASAFAKSPVKPADPADTWVQKREQETPAPEAIQPDPIETEPMKRFTIDVPMSLHRRVKATCAQRGLKMADVIRDFLEREFPA